MIYLLFIGVLILLFISFFLFKKNILNPSVILCSVFLVSLFFSILNIKKWGINFHLNTVLIILGAIIAFILGNSVIYLLPKKNRYRKIYHYIYSVSFKDIFFLNLISSVILYKYFQEIYELSLIGGNPGGYNLMLYYARHVILLTPFGISKILVYCVYLVRSISLVCFFIFSYLTIFKKFKIKNLFLLFPIVIYCGIIILSTGRTDFIYLLVYMLIIFFILYQQKHNFSFFVTKKIIFYGIISFILFLIIFNLTGSLKGSILTKEAIFNRISIYVGSSTPAFDVYVNSLKKSNIYFGENTLFLIYNILRKLGYGIPKLCAPYEPIYFINGEYTNIYGAIRRYYEDFGIEGLLLITFLLGLFYGIFFYNASYKKNNFFILILYGALCFPIFEFPIEERFFMLLFPQGFVYNFVTLGIIYYFLVYRKIKREKLKL